jgi:hypothetical protein
MLGGAQRDSLAPGRFLGMNSETAEGRRSQRRRMLKDGRILLPGSWVTYDCVIRDVSETGARLRLASETMLMPEKFELVFVADQIAYPVKLRWRRNTECGVEYAGPPRKVSARFR